MSCNSFNVIYVVFCFGCLEQYTSKISEGKTKSRKSEYTNNMNGNLSIKKSICELLKTLLSKYIHFWHDNILLIQI